MLAWRASVLALVLILTQTSASCRITAGFLDGSNQGFEAAAVGRREEDTGPAHLRYTGRQLQQAARNGSGLRQQVQAQPGNSAQLASSDTDGGSSSVLTAAHATQEAVLAANGSVRRPIWVDIGGERLDATAGGLEYEDGEQAERSAPADGPLRQPRLPMGLVRRHLKIAPYRAEVFAAQRAAAWQQILDGQ